MAASWAFYMALPLDIRTFLVGIITGIAEILRSLAGNAAHADAADADKVNQRPDIERPRGSPMQRTLRVTPPRWRQRIG